MSKVLEFKVIMSSEKDGSRKGLAQYLRLGANVVISNPGNFDR